MSVDAILKKLSAMEEKQNALAGKVEALESARVTKARPDLSGRAPAVRKGEDPMSSRGFMYSRLFAAMSGLIPAEQAKVEFEVAKSMRTKFVDAGLFRPERSSIMAPFSTAYLPDNFISAAERRTMKSMLHQGVADVDLDEARWLIGKAYHGYAAKAAQSWIDPVLGGDLVGPPEFGELIELFRNRDALVNAGARTIPLPPTGRIKFPRQTVATNGQWLGENQQGNQTNFEAGALTLSAKKVMALVVLPNELLRFATAAAEALARMDMTKTLSLTMDQGLLEGPGGDELPLGLINTPGVATVTPTTVGANGNQLAPQDFYEFPSVIEQNNAEFEGFVLRPELYWKAVEARAAVYNGSGTVAQGQFVYSQMRELGQGFAKVLAGFPATTTNQVSKSRVKGTGTNLTYLAGGMWSDFLIALFGGIEFLATDQGLTLLQSDQTAIRAIMSCDGGPRHPAAFCVADQLLVAVGP